jgi:hypothetical protein
VGSFPLPGKPPLSAAPKLKLFCLGVCLAPDRLRIWNPPARNSVLLIAHEMLVYRVSMEAVRHLRHGGMSAALQTGQDAPAPP